MPNSTASSDAGDVLQKNALQEAIAHHQAGRLHDAERIYRDVLRMDPNHSDANHNLGMIAVQVGKPAEALPLLETALLVNQTDVQYSLSYAGALLEAGHGARARSFLEASVLKGLPDPRVRTLRRRAEAMTPGHVDALPVLLRSIRASSRKRARSPTRDQEEKGISKNFLHQLQLARTTALKDSGSYSALEGLSRLLIAQDPDCGHAWMTLGFALFEQQKSACHAFQRAASLLPDKAHAHGNLGISLAMAGKLEDACASYRRALELDPDCAQYHNNLANGLNGLGQVHEAQAHYCRALEIAPDYADAHYNFGNTLLALDRLSEAEECYRNTLAHQPNFFRAHHNLGLLLKRIGQFAPSLQSLQRAIALLLATLREQPASGQQAAPASAPKKPMNLQAACHTLDALRATLEDAGIAWCLVAGSALGIYRDGDLLAHDKDVDVAMPATVERDRLVRLLTEKNDFKLLQHFGSNNEDLHEYSMSFRHTVHGICVDIFFLHPDGEDHYLTGAAHPVQPILCRISRFDFSVHPWRDALWPIPSRTERYLEEVYGSNWRSPDRHFDTVISNPSRIAQAIPVALCYGYSRLLGCLLAHDWERARSLCRQLLARHADPLLGEVDQWLSSLAVEPKVHA